MRHLSSLTILAFIVLAASLLAAITSTHVDASNAPPAPPANVQASDGTYAYMVKITWNPSPGATSYRIFRANELDGNRTSIANATVTYYEDYSAWGGLQIHYYWVIACTGSGSDCSDIDDGTPNSGFRGLATPDVFASDGTYSDKVRITWSSVQSAASYTLYRGTSEAGYNTALAGLTTTSYDDTNALRGTIYYYWVKAVADIDESHISGPNTGYRNYAAPTGVQATDGTHLDRVRITWLGSANATRYQVWRAPAASGTPQKLSALSSPPYDDTTTAPGVSYEYSVSACNSDETICSQRSNQDTGYRGQPTSTPTTSPTPTRTPLPTGTSTATFTPRPTGTATSTRPPGALSKICLPMLLK